MPSSLRAGSSVLTALVLIVTIAVPSEAGPGSKQAGTNGKGGKNASALRLVVIEPDGGEARHAGTVTFEVETSATDRPHVSLVCTQGGDPVYWSSAGFYEDYPWQWAREFVLSSSYWTGGAADCLAELYYHDGRRFRTLTDLGFTASA